MQIDTTAITNLSSKDAQKAEKALDGVSSRQAIEAKAREFEEIFIADSLKNAKIGMADSSLVTDTKITDTFSTFMNQALAKVIVSQGGFELTKNITQSLLQQQKLTPNKL